MPSGVLIPMILQEWPRPVPALFDAGIVAAA